MVGASCTAKDGPNRLAAWDQAEELVALDRLRFQHLHRVIYAHRQRVENAESYYDALETERQAEIMHKRAEAMRISRAKRKEEAVDTLKRNNQRMVERLCVVMRQSESRQQSLASPSKPPGSAPAGSLNLSYRKKAARQIDQDNKILLDRLIRIRPTVSTRAELESRYQVYSSLVHRHSRLRRPLHKADVFRIPPPPIRAPRASKRKALEARSRGGKNLASGGSKEKEVSVKTTEAPGRKATPEPLKGAKEAARTELAKVNQNVLHKIAGEGEEVNAQKETMTPGAAQVPKQHEETDQGDDASSHYSDFDSEGEDNPKEKSKVEASNPEESEEYEDDYEADDYSDAFEDDDSSHLSSPRLSPKKEVMATMQEASDEETDLNHTNTATAPQESGQEEDPLEKSDDFEDEFEAESDHDASGGSPDAEVAEDNDVLDDFEAEDQEAERVESDPDPPLVGMEGDEIDHNSVPSIKSDPDNLVVKAPSEEIAQALSEHVKTVAALNESEIDHNSVPSIKSDPDNLVVKAPSEEIAQALNESEVDHHSVPSIKSDHDDLVVKAPSEEIAQALNESEVDHHTVPSIKSDPDDLVVKAPSEEIAQALSEHMKTVAALNESESDKVVNDRKELNETNEDITVHQKVSEIDEINEVNEENEVSNDYTDFEADSQSPSKKEALPSGSGVGLAGASGISDGVSATPSSIGIGGAGPPRGMSQGRGWSEDFEDDDGINEDQELRDEVLDQEVQGASNLLDDGSPSGGRLFGSEDDSIREDSGESLNFVG